MQIRYLTEDDVAATLDVATTIELLDRAARALAAGEAMSLPRQRPRLGRTTMHVLPAAYGGRLGHKTYVSGAPGGGIRFWVTLFDAATGAMLALIEADTLGQIRTGAASGLATRIMARGDARVGAVIGAGHQAETQLEAICRARPLERVLVSSRTFEHAQALCARMQPKVGAALEAVADGATAVRDADVVCTITSATQPVLLGAWLRVGVHVNAAGSNHEARREIDAEVIRRAALIAVEDVAQAKIESGDLLAAEREGAFDWPRAQRLADLVAAGPTARRRDDDVTLFESLGVGLWDVAAANHVYDRCVAEGRGNLVTLRP
jgi:ornithine cyclodeaminase/alanine dehydrogenase-like protein (mu-crystallin family)